MGNYWKGNDDCTRTPTDYIEKRIKNEIMHTGTMYSTIDMKLSRKLNIKLWLRIN
jgi:hypothetical protein